MTHNTGMATRPEMADSQSFGRARAGALLKLRMEPGLEARFRQALRARLTVPRTVMFLILALAFGLSPLYNHILHRPDAAVAPLLAAIQLYVALPVLLAASAVTYFSVGRSITQAVQMAAVIAAVGSVTFFRYLALTTGMLYPAQIAGVIFIGIAFFGGFSWRRVALGTLVFSAAAVALEFWKERPDTAPLLQSYSLFFMALIACVSAFVQEGLTRLNWWEVHRLRNVRAALRQSEQRFEAFMDHMPAIAWIKDADGRYHYRNQQHCDRYGKPGEDWTGKRDTDYFHESSAATYNETDQQVAANGEALEYETLNYSRDGTSNQWWIQKFPITDDSGERLVGGIGVDVGERKRLEQQLRESEVRFQMFLDHSPTISWMKDQQGRYLYASDSFREFLGVTDDSWRGSTDADYFSPKFAKLSQDHDQQVLESGVSVETEGAAKDAQGINHHWLLLRFRFTDLGGRHFIGGVATDVTARKRAEDLVRLQSLTDEMTGLYNRRGFYQLVNQQLKRVQLSHVPCVLMYVDLDDLKHINETHGHDGGDLALTSVAEALRVAVRASDIVARVGGDEFVVFAMNCEDVGAFRQRIEDALVDYNLSDALPFQVSISVGLSEFSSADDIPIEQRMTEADRRMLVAKRERKA